MISDSRIRQPNTAEQFAESKWDLPDGGRWYELHDGIPTIMEPPDDNHGNAVLNLSRAIAEWIQSGDEQQIGYVCPEIGLKVSFDPDSVYCPAISFFDSGSQFEEFDNPIASRTPRLVVDVASANDRRADMGLRTQAYLNLGVDIIWVPDPYKKEVQVITEGRHTVSLGAWQNLEGAKALPGFEIKVEDMFAQPSWWTGPKRS